MRGKIDFIENAKGKKQNLAAVLKC
jgi:hypothetical protein